MKIENHTGTFPIKIEATIWIIVQRFHQGVASNHNVPYSIHRTERGAYHRRIEYMDRDDGDKEYRFEYVIEAHKLEE